MRLGPRNCFRHQLNVGWSQLGHLSFFGMLFDYDTSEKLAVLDNVNNRSSVVFGLSAFYHVDCLSPFSCFVERGYRLSVGRREGDMPRADRLLRFDDPENGSSGGAECTGSSLRENGVPAYDHF